MDLPLIITATGHRPNRLGGYGDRIADALVLLAREYLQAHEPDSVIVGMALGWDLAVAKASQQLGIVTHAAVPFEGQESRWPEAQQRRYREALRLCSSVSVVSPGGYSSAAMHARDRWMVDRAQLILALWDGTPSGTGATVRYATDQGRPVLNLWPTWLHRAQRRS